MGMYNHSTSSSAYSIISGRNNFNASYNSFINGTFNNVPYTYLGHKTVFGNGNVVNGSVGLTSGVALLNKSFGTTVIGKLTRITPILNKVLILKQPHFYCW
jgi:hypothetical protein